MARVIKYVFLLAFAALAVWGGWTLLHPDGNEPFPAGDEPLPDGAVFRVMLDPGHGDTDAGAVVGDVQEKDINLAVALLVREQLEEQEGVEVLMTREDDSFLSLTERAELANQKKVDLYVSLHSNSLEDDSFEGIMTFYWTSRSKDAAQTIQSAVLSATGAVDRNVRTEEYVVIRETKMPSVLIEMGFMTCPDELERLTDPDYQKLLAQGIVQGILSCAS